MAKSYHLKEIIARELNHPCLSRIHRTNRNEKKNLCFSQGNQHPFLDEAMVWKTALQLEASGLELFD
jgi:hypothetical protein